METGNGNTAIFITCTFHIFILNFVDGQSSVNLYISVNAIKLLISLIMKVETKERLESFYMGGKVRWCLSCQNVK